MFLVLSDKTLAFWVQTPGILKKKIPRAKGHSTLEVQWYVFCWSFIYLISFSLLVREQDIHTMKNK